MTAELKAFSDTMETFNVKRFHEYIKTHQAMLFPAFQMQLALQRKFLGVPYWEKSADKRIKLCKGKYISIEKFLLSVRFPLIHERILLYCLLTYPLFVPSEETALPQMWTAPLASTTGRSAPRSCRCRPSLAPRS